MFHAYLFKLCRYAHALVTYSDGHGKAECEKSLHKVCFTIANCDDMWEYQAQRHFWDVRSACCIKNIRLLSSNVQTVHRSRRHTTDNSWSRRLLGIYAKWAKRNSPWHQPMWMWTELHLSQPLFCPVSRAPHNTCWETPTSEPCSASW